MEKEPKRVSRRKPGAPGDTPGSFQIRPYDVIDIVIAETPAVNSEWVHIGHPAEVGLYVPALTTAATVTIKVAHAADGTGGAGLVNGDGDAILVLASGSGDVNISSNDLGAILGYGWIRITLGAAQAAAKTFKLTRKSVSTAPL